MLTRNTCMYLYLCLKLCFSFPWDVRLQFSIFSLQLVIFWGAHSWTKITVSMSSMCLLMQVYPSWLRAIQVSYPCTNFDQTGKWHGETIWHFVFTCCVHVHTHTHARMHTRTHARTHTHTHTHTHIHSYQLVQLTTSGGSLLFLLWAVFFCWDYLHSLSSRLFSSLWLVTQLWIASYSTTHHMDMYDSLAWVEMQMSVSNF